MKCACSSPHIDCEGVIPIAQPASRHSTPLYWGKVLNYFEIERKSKDPTPQVDGKRDIKSTKEYQSQIEWANRALRFLKSRGVHLGYGIQEFNDEQQVRRYIHVDRSFTLPMRSDLKVQGLDAVANESRRDFNEKQIGVSRRTLFSVFHHHNSDRTDTIPAFRCDNNPLRQRPLLRHGARAFSYPCRVLSVAWCNHYDGCNPILIHDKCVPLACAAFEKDGAFRHPQFCNQSSERGGESLVGKLLNDTLNGDGYFGVMLSVCAGVHISGELGGTKKC